MQRDHALELCRSLFGMPPLAIEGAEDHQRRNMPRIACDDTSQQALGARVLAVLKRRHASLIATDWL
jgi:hypothetical protein